MRLIVGHVPVENIVTPQACQHLLVTVAGDTTVQRMSLSALLHQQV